MTITSNSKHERRLLYFTHTNAPLCALLCFFLFFFPRFASAEYTFTHVHTGSPTDIIDVSVVWFELAAHTHIATNHTIQKKPSCMKVSFNYEIKIRCHTRMCKLQSRDAVSWVYSFRAQSWYIFVFFCVVILSFRFLRFWQIEARSYEFHQRERKQSDIHRWNQQQNQARTIASSTYENRENRKKETRNNRREQRKNKKK